MTDLCLYVFSQTGALLFTAALYSDLILYARKFTKSKIQVVKFVILEMQQIND